MTVSNIRNHPYTLEHALQATARHPPSKQPLQYPQQQPYHQQPQQQQPFQQQQPSKKSTSYFTWLVFMNASWVPFDLDNQSKLEQTLNLNGTFVDVHDSHFPKVNRVRVFPKSNYLSYLGVKYRLSRVIQPDAWIELPNYDHPSSSGRSSTSTDEDIDEPLDLPPAYSIAAKNRLSPILAPLSPPAAQVSAHVSIGSRKERDTSLRTYSPHTFPIPSRVA